ncbi:hypothetical protein MBLNU230_g1853t1 [Neophaeotheca triangularis]
MKLLQVLPFAALTTAFVLPSEEVLQDIAIESNHRGNSWTDQVASTKDSVLQEFKDQLEEVSETYKDAWEQVQKKSKNAVDAAIEQGSDALDSVNSKVHETAFDAQSWLDSSADEVYEYIEEAGHGHGGHHGHHDHKPNMTVYQLISESKYTTKLAKLINKYDDLVETLNGTQANYTVFAPTDKAFAKIPEHAPEPSREQLKKLLEYHVSPDFYPAGRVLATHTVPTLLKVDSLGAEPRPQRLSFNIGLRGLTVNFYSRIVAVNIFGTNGVIHGVDSIILPPPNVIKIIDLLPSEFSTLELGLGKTGLLEQLNSTDHHGGTFFAPSNFAFTKLGPKINAFLFSSYGQKYLKALLQYHVVPDNTLYSDAYYNADRAEQEGVPKGYFHVDLPTMLEDRSLSINIARYGGLIEMKINAFSRVTAQDGIAEDGVIQVVSDVLVPPKKVGGPGSTEVEHWDGSEMSVEDFTERLEPYVVRSDL